MLNKIKAVLWNWNIPEDKLACIKEEIDDYNYNRLFFTECAFAIICVLSFVYSLSYFLYDNAVVLNGISVAIACFLVLFTYCFENFCRKHIRALFYLQINLAMVMTVLIDAFGPTDLAVLYAPNVLLFMCIYIERPYKLYSLFIVWEFIFIYCASFFKGDYELYTDILDTVVYTIMAMLVGYHINRIKVQNLYNIYELTEVKLREANARLKNMELDLLQRQISPHFIYNTMNAISGLCKVDPVKAEELINMFAQFLRSNIDTLGNKKLISFKEELDNVNCFVNIISIRYQEEYDIIYDLQETQFQVPIFSLEPIVENAIVHGLKEVKTDKRIFITSKREVDTIHLTVKDNGKGFVKVEEHPHISTGLKNVAYRLEQLVQARLEITSVPELGTTVDIWIPVKDK